MRNEEKSGFDEKSPYIALRIAEHGTWGDRSSLINSQSNFLRENVNRGLKSPR